MTTIKVSYKTVYNRRKQLDRNGKASVLIEAYQGGKRRYLKTGYHLTPNEWDYQKQEIKRRPDLNKLIRDRITELENFEVTFSALYNRPFKLKDFDLLIDSKQVKANEPPSFSTFALEQIERDRKDNVLAP